MNKKEFGYIGEKITCKFLTKRGYKIVENNFCYRGGEIDVIAFDIENKELVFIEVKTRSNKNYGNPIESVSNFKLNRIVRGASYFLYKRRLYNCNIRFDIIELYYSNDKFYINHIKQVI